MDNWRNGKAFKSGVNRGFWTNVVIPLMLKRAGYKCSRCDSINNLEVHHKDYDVQIIENFEVLCKSCHKKVHVKILECENNGT